MTQAQVRTRLIELIRSAVDDDDPSADAEQQFAILRDDSIELMALGFECQKAFGVQIDYTALFDTTDLGVEPATALVPRAGLDVLGARFPFLALDRLPDPVRVDDLRNALTVDAMTGLILHLQARKANRPAPGTAAATA